MKRNSSEHVPSLYSCNLASSALGSIFQHQLVKQFQISTPTLAYSYSYPPLSPPSILPSLPLSLLWSHFTVEPSGAYPNLSLGRGPKAVHGPPELSCELSTFPSAPFPHYFAGSPFTQNPSLPILGGFWMGALKCSGCSYAPFTGHV